MGSQKIGRNSPCHCGSGLKYKRCHGNPALEDRRHRLPHEAIQLAVQQARAHEQQRVAQQGLGKGIISTQVQDQRVVAVGNKINYSNKWKTFQDFLHEYIKDVLDPAWGTAELQKPSEPDMHPVIQWYRHVCRLQAQFIKKPGEVYSAPETAAARAFLDLAYNLYLLGHNVELRSRLIGRLKNPDQFAGALTEVRVAGMLIRAGFKVEFEDEDDPTSTHCEYAATHRETGKSFSVEVKTRVWSAHPPNTEDGKRTVQVATRRLLRAALEKRAAHERIVFIELDVPDDGADGSDKPWFLDAAFDGVRAEQEEAARAGRQLPSAYVIVANHPYRHHPDATVFRVGMFAEGVGALDFHGDWRGTLREALHHFKPLGAAPSSCGN